MKKVRIVSLGLAALLVLLLVQVAGAGSSANYAINWQVLSGGGAPAGAGNVTLNGSMGQPVIGLTSTGNTQIRSGYWYGITTSGPGGEDLYLPVILSNS